jgi:hypothetical protein
MPNIPLISLAAAASLSVAAAAVVLTDDGESARVHASSEAAGPPPAAGRSGDAPRRDFGAHAFAPVHVDPDPIEDPDRETSTPDAEPDPAAQERVLEQHERELVVRLADQPRDAEWSGATESAVHEALSGVAFAGVHLVGAQCASTLCRVELSADDEAGRERALAALPMTEPFATNGLIRQYDQHGDEPQTLVVFFTREGTPL